MNLFHRKDQGAGPSLNQEQAALAESVINAINDGVLIVDPNGLIKLINPAAARMTGNVNASDCLGLSYLSVIKMETPEGMTVLDNKNPLAIAMVNNQAWQSRDFYLVTLQGDKLPVSITLTPSGGRNTNRIITLRSIAEELEKEGEQTEFISTASHEMRTPVASIEGYLGLALNPQTATIDDRARQYLTEAHNASKHLGKLFQDLLDVTKLDDHRSKLHLVPAEMVSTVSSIATQLLRAINTKNLAYNFGSNSESVAGDSTSIEQPVYAMVDMDFLQEIINNLIENAVKYTPAGGSLWVNVRADGDNVLINVSDTGIGISPDNLTHIFQKFYRADNSATRTEGGTGLGLYLVKQRTEAMGGRVWAESSFGEGSTFYVSLPRISAEEYERQQQIIQNIKAMPIGPAMQNPSAMGSAALNTVEQTQPQAVPVQPQAAPIQPQAAPVQPQAAPIQPQAAPIQPQAASQNSTSIIQ